MEKKGAFQSQSSNVGLTIEPLNNEPISKHAHQHNNAPQHLRFLQYGLKIPNHQHPQIPQTHAHQQLNPPPPHTHVHQQYQTTHRHLQPSPQQFNSINIHQNPSYPNQNNKYVHQHVLQNQPIYQTTQPPPSSVHAHNQMTQNTPQIWVPHQPPPIHYHQQQQQQKAEVQKAHSPTTSQVQAKPKEVAERKKSSIGGSSHLRSPSAKRPLEAPVTMQGWLHKQGSEGLMLWKKRWFVLSEYCLFYYKGLEEEKLLGSILLPSYNVSICGPEDKVNRKYAFKCEHANMRTYILAADSQDLMMQWVRVLNLACILQTNVDNEPSSAAIEQSMPQHKLMDSSENNVQQKQNAIHAHSSSSTTDLSNPSQHERSQYNQPLYANAPPKPRRLNDGFSSPSPEVLDRYPQYIETCRSIAKSPCIYGQTVANPQIPQPEYYQQSRPKENPREYVFTPTRELHNSVQNVERRTPDTYGRSRLHPTKLRHPTDYEDVYNNDQTMYKRPLSPIAYTHVVKKNNPQLNPAYRAYTPVNMLGPTDMVQYIPQQLRKSPSCIARPHSADFLEYEINHRQPNSSALSRQQPRPKSSLDINRNVNDSDNYFYSEERYAEKMRKSAQYLHKMPTRLANPGEVIHQKNVPITRYPESDNTFPLMRSNTQPINFNTLAPPESQPVRSRSVLSEGSLSKEIDMELCGSPRNITERESISPRYSTHDIYDYNNSNTKNREYDQFTRSASARLAQSIPQNERPQEILPMTREGERKREESMRRLLEWKQRMLQSPLNRKTQVNRGYRGRNENFHMNPESCYPMDSHSKHGEPPIENRRPVTSLPQYNSYSSDDEASGSISINTRDMAQINARDTFPRAISVKKVWSNSQPFESRSVTNLNRSHEVEQFGVPNPQGYYISQGGSQHDLPPEAAHQINTRKENWAVNDKMNVSAGELLGRTHEELVLLLIQLRRQSAQTLQAIENCYNEIDTMQAQLHILDQVRRLEHLQKLEQIKQHLLELEKQYEKGKPLVNLVDNMVKLGSLYRVPTDRPNLSPYIRDRLEFNQQIQERRLLAEEKREWNRLNPNHFHLQEKVQQLYQLDRLIHEESGTLQNLQQDKEDIERALGGLRHRLTKGFNDPAEVEQARKQQVLLENELSRVHLMLAQNSKKLEETVAGNARLEQELLVLKQKLQTTRQQRNSQQYSNASDSLTCAVGNSAMLESDLHRVQKKIGDLQKQRQELSIQVRQLTDRSSNLPQPKSSPSGSIQNSQCNKKKIVSSWRETDLDTMNIVDHGDSWEGSVSTSTSTPLYINTDMKQLGESDFYSRGMKSSDSTSDSTSLNSNVPQEKQEIKTVRIVKRESERRQRDREKTTTGKWDAVMEEDDSSQNSSILFRPTPIQKIASAVNLASPEYEESKNEILNRQSSVSSPNLPQCSDRVNSSTDVSMDKSPELSPVFKSEAARQIITEMSIHDMPKQSNRRAVPKEKRRHYTAPHNNMIMKSFHQLPTDNNAFNKMILNNRRARDDLDMERALRQRIDAPDVVRSTLSNKEFKYNESTIDNILGTPNKISIPERYIPEQLPQLSAEEQEYRLRKVESIKKMLSDTALISSSSANLPSEDKQSDSLSNTTIASKATTKMIEEKKQREHLLHLNQILAKQVMEMSKIVAGTNTSDEK